MTGQEPRQAHRLDRLERSHCRGRIEGEPPIGRRDRAVPTSEQGIAGETDAIGSTEDDAAGRMTGCADHLEAVDAIAVSEEEIGVDRADAEQTVEDRHRLGALRGPFASGQDRGIALMDGDLGTRTPPEGRGAPDMIGMPMGEHDGAKVVRGNAQLRHRVEDPPGIAGEARVDKQQSVIELDEVGVADAGPADSVDAPRNLDHRHGLPHLNCERDPWSRQAPILRANVARVAAVPVSAIGIP